MSDLAFEHEFDGTEDIQTKTSCFHCGLIVPPTEYVQDCEQQFCCSGCRTVHELLNEHGLERFYDIREGEDLPLKKAASQGVRAYNEFDNAAFQEKFVQQLDSGLCRMELYLENVHCAACMWLIERLDKFVPAIAKATLDMGRSRATILWDPATAPASAIARAIASIGYLPHPYTEEEHTLRRKKEDREYFIRMASCGAIAGNIMLLSFALYGGAIEGIEKQYSGLFRWLSMLLTIPSLFIGGKVFFRGALSALKQRYLHMDLPISIGIIAGFAGGAYHTILGHGEVYFDSVSALIFLLLVARYLQKRQQRRASEASSLLATITPNYARKVNEDGVAEEVVLSSIEAGDKIEVLASMRIATDGIVVEGESSVDESLLSGESRPIQLQEGSTVHAGSVNLGSKIIVEVTKVGLQSRVGQLMQLVEDASLLKAGGHAKAKLVQYIDQISGKFSGTVLALAAICFTIWIGSGIDLALEHTIALLVVTCPCALGLATPLAIAAAAARATRHGLIVQGTHVFEALSKKGTLWLDKTGTLTEGNFEVLKWQGDAELKSVWRALEAESSHPIAQAISYAFSGETSCSVCDNIKQEASGILGEWNSKKVALGSAAFLESHGQHFSLDQKKTFDAWSEQGLSPLAMGVDGQVLSMLALGDRIRPEAKALLEHLGQAGWKLGILSGDHQRVVNYVGASLGIDPERCLGEHTPEQKLSQIVASLDELKDHENSSVVMVGDGINDAAALSAATVGIGVQSEAEATLRAADVYASQPGLRALTQLFDESSATMKRIKLSLVFSLLYNCVGASLALAGLIHPLVAAVLMPVSSLTVVINSYRKPSNSKAQDTKLEVTQ